MSGAANAFPIPAMAKPRKPHWPLSCRCRKLSGRGLNRVALQTAMPPCAARNALDCALLDLEAKTSGRRAWDLLGRPAPRPCTTAYTISLASPEAMAAATARPPTGGCSRSNSAATATARASPPCVKQPPNRAHRRRQRSVDDGQSRAKSRRMRKGRRYAGRAAAAGRSG